MVVTLKTNCYTKLCKNLLIFVTVIAFSFTAAAQKGNVRLDEASGYTPTASQLAACRLIDNLPPEFQDSFKVYDFGFYLGYSSCDYTRRTNIKNEHLMEPDIKWLKNAFKKKLMKKLNQLFFYFKFLILLTCCTKLTDKQECVQVDLVTHENLLGYYSYLFQDTFPSYYFESTKFLFVKNKALLHESNGHSYPVKFTPLSGCFSGF